jgi:tyrosine-protein kinase Etk/Wzc
MSRIHDALKKAERERARQSITSLEAENAEPGDIAGTAAEAQFPPLKGDKVFSVQSNFVDEFEPFTIETLDAGVPRTKWNPDPKTMLFFGHESYAPGTEEFRTLRTRLYGMRDLQPLRSIMVTSSSPGEGKTFISANLAQIFVQQPKCRALLIDGDLRWSRAHLSLGAPATPGLSDYLMGEANELAIVQRGPLDNLYFIPGGKHSSNPSELIANGRLGQMLQRLAPLFDWVILDTPPAMVASDARLIARACDGVLMVVSAGVGSYVAAQKTEEQFKNRRLLGVVLNRAEARLTYSYKYYEYYYGSDKGRRRKGKR